MRGSIFNKGYVAIRHPFTQNLDLSLIHYTKINLKWIIDLNTKCKTTKLLEETGGNLLDLALGKEFLVMTEGMLC